MNPDRADLAQQIFADAIDRPAGERAAIVRDACGGDEALYEQIMALLAAHDRASGFLDRPIQAPTDALASPNDPNAATDPGPALSLPPASIGPYRVRRPIGSGGMGTVYEAIQDHPRRIVAVKVMRRGLGSPASSRRFALEADLLGRLRHPGIAQVFEAGEYHDPSAPPGAPPVPYFAMEYIPGAHTLTEFARVGQLSTRARLDLFCRVCEAVHHGHSRGIVHRDLKPSNILVDSSGDIPQPKIIDFGVARATDSDLAATTLATEANQLIGTLQYMSPEQAGASDARDIDARSDVYSLGVVLYELLCGTLPYDLAGCSISEATRRIREAQPPSPAAIDPNLRGDLETITLKALHKDRARRYQTAAALKEDLDRFLAGDPILARGDSITYIARTKARRWITAHRWATRAFVVAVTVVIVQTVGMRLVFVWTPLNGWVERAMGAVASSRRSGLDQVRLVAIRDAPSAIELAAAVGVDPTGLAHPKAMRLFHGKLMRRMAEAFSNQAPGEARPTGLRPKGVVWDLEFIDDSVFDAEFVGGAGALESLGIPVNAAAPCWNLDDQAMSGMSRLIRDAVRFGAATGHFGEHEPWKANLAVQRLSGEVVPSLALTAFAADQAPFAESFRTLDRDAYCIRLWYSGPSPGGGKVRQHVEGVPSLTYSALLVEAKDDPENCIRSGDQSVLLTLQLPSDAEISAATTPYHELVTMPHDALRATLAGRYVVVCDDRESSRDRAIPTPDGRTLHGAVGHAAALAALSGRGTVRMPTSTQEIVFVVLGALVGVVAATRSARPTAWIILGVAGATVAACLIAQSLFLIRCNPLMPLLAAGVAGLVGRGVTTAHSPSLAKEP